MKVLLDISAKIIGAMAMAVVFMCFREDKKTQTMGVIALSIVVLASAM